MSGEKRDRADVIAFAPYWNNKAGKFDTRSEYVASFRERNGFFRGAKINSTRKTQQQKG